MDIEQSSLFLSQKDVAFITGYQRTDKQKTVLDHYQLVVVADHAKAVLSGELSTLRAPGSNVDLSWLEE